MTSFTLIKSVFFLDFTETCTLTSLHIWIYSCVCQLIHLLAESRNIDFHFRGLTAWQCCKALLLSDLYLQGKTCVTGGTEAVLVLRQKGVIVCAV